MLHNTVCNEPNFPSVRVVALSKDHVLLLSTIKEQHYASEK